MCTWILDHPKDFAEIAALASAALFFLYRAVAGYLRVNLSVSLIFLREPRRDQSTDNLVVSVRLAKGPNGSIALHDATARITVDGNVQVLPFPGTSRSKRVQSNERSSINWSEVEQSSPLLKLVPGEETELALTLAVPNNSICLIEVAVLGKRVFGTAFGQWKASGVSLPRTV
jgi:hypothetical protein